MIYNPNGELVEQKNFQDASSDPRSKWKPVTLTERSNIFKNSVFVTNSNFKGGNNKVNSGTHNSSAFDWFLPTRKHFTNRNYLTTKRPHVNQPSLVNTVHGIHVFGTTTVTPAPELNDEITLIQNSLITVNDGIFKDHIEHDSTTEKLKPVESIKENPIIFSYSTLAPATSAPVPVLPTRKKKKKKRKNNRRKISQTTSKPGYENLTQTKDSNRKIGSPSIPRQEIKNIKLITGSGVISLTPRPTLAVSSNKTNSKGDQSKVKNQKAKKRNRKKPNEEDYSSEYSQDVDEDRTDQDVIYVDAPADYDYVGNFFSKFYSFFEDTLTSKEVVDYGKDVSNSDSESEEYDEYHGKRRKRENLAKRTRNQSDNSLESRKTLTTKITVTSEYDEPAIANQSNATSSTMAPSRRPITVSSEESEELTFYENIIATGGDYDDSTDADDEEDVDDIKNEEDSEAEEDDEIDSYEYDDEPASIRLPDEDVIRDSPEEDSDENDAPSFSFFDGVSSMFSTIGRFFSSFTGMGGSTRVPPSVEDLSTTEKAEQQSKRPKRENEPLPWYQPSFLFSDDDNDDEKVFSSTTHRNWLQSPWLQIDDDDNEIATEIPLTTTTEDSTLMSSSEKPSYSFLEMVTQYISPRKRATNLKSKVKKLRRKKYDDYELWRILPKSKDDINTIQEFKMSREGTEIHWLKGPSSRGISDVVVPPDYVENFKDFLTENDIKFDVKVRDIQHAIQFENPRLNKRDQIELEVINGHPLTWYRYHHYRDIQAYYEYLKRKFPEYTELIQLGWSFEGRPLTVVKVSYPGNGKEDPRLLKEHRSTPSKKPAIVIQSGLEAHEWLPIACSTYILNNLVNDIESNSTLGQMIRKVDWYFMPVMNPDGYDYSIHYDRLWQKTRSKHLPSGSIWDSA